MILLILNILKKIKKYRNPAEYWRKHGTVIGQNCEIYPTADFGSEPYLITIGNHVRVNSGVTFVTHDGGVWVLRGLKEELRDIDLFGRISIGDNVHVGTNALIMPGVKIGTNCIIGCSAVVTRSIPDNSIAVGVPARVVETIDEYFKKHKDDFERTKGLDGDEKRKYLMKKFEVEL